MTGRSSSIVASAWASLPMSQPCGNAGCVQIGLRIERMLEQELAPRPADRAALDHSRTPRRIHGGNGAADLQEPDRVGPHDLSSTGCRVWMSDEQDAAPQLDRRLVVRRLDLDDLVARAGERWPARRTPSAISGCVLPPGGAASIATRRDPGSRHVERDGDATRGRADACPLMMPARAARRSRAGHRPSTAISWMPGPRSSGGITVACGTRPMRGLIDEIPQQCAGLRSEPPTSLPRPSGDMPARARTPRRRRAARGDARVPRVAGQPAQAGVGVDRAAPCPAGWCAPIRIAPAARSRSTMRRVDRGDRLGQRQDARVVGVPPGRCSP